MAPGDTKMQLDDEGTILSSSPPLAPFSFTPAGDSVLARQVLHTCQNSQMLSLHTSTPGRPSEVMIGSWEVESVCCYAIPSPQIANDAAVRSARNDFWKIGILQSFSSPSDRRFSAADCGNDLSSWIPRELTVLSKSTWTDSPYLDAFPRNGVGKSGILRSQNAVFAKSVSTDFSATSGLRFAPPDCAQTLSFGFWSECTAGSNLAPFWSRMRDALARGDGRKLAIFDLLLFTATSGPRFSVPERDWKLPFGFWVVPDVLSRLEFEPLSYLDALACSGEPKLAFEKISLMKFFDRSVCLTAGGGSSKPGQHHVASGSAARALGPDLGSGDLQTSKSWKVSNEHNSLSPPYVCTDTSYSVSALLDSICPGGDSQCTSHRGDYLDPGDAILPIISITNTGEFGSIPSSPLMQDRNLLVFSVLNAEDLGDQDPSYTQTYDSSASTSGSSRISLTDTGFRGSGERVSLPLCNHRDLLSLSVSPVSAYPQSDGLGFDSLDKCHSFPDSKGKISYEHLLFPVDLPTLALSDTYNRCFMGCGASFSMELVGFHKHFKRLRCPNWMP